MSVKMMCVRVRVHVLDSDSCHGERKGRVYVSCCVGEVK